MNRYLVLFTIPVRNSKRIISLYFGPLTNKKKCFANRAFAYWEEHMLALMEWETKIIKSLRYIVGKETKIEYNWMLCSITIYLKIAYVQAQINSIQKRIIKNCWTYFFIRFLMGKEEHPSKCYFKAFNSDKENMEKVWIQVLFSL